MEYKYEKAEKDLSAKLVNYSESPEIQSQMGEAFYVWKNDPDFISEEITAEEIDDVTFEKFFDWFIYDFKLLDSQERIIDRYYREENGKLSPIEQRMLKDWKENLYSFFEVEDVSVGQGCLIRDIFTNKLIEVSDKSSSKGIKRSDIIGARPLISEKHSYFSGVVSVYPATFKGLIINFFNNEYKQYRKLQGKEKTKRDYLKDLGFLTGNYVENIVSQPRFITPEGEEFILASATYQLNDYTKVLRKIERIKSLKRIGKDSDELNVFTWEKRGKNQIAGTLEIESQRLRVECHSLEMLNKAKAKIEKDLKGLIRHLEDLTRESKEFINKKEGRSERLNKLPLGAKSENELNRILDEHYDKWIDQPLSLLGGLTPNEALKSNADRERLNSIVNELEIMYEQAKKRGEPYYDVQKLRKRLRLEHGTD